MNERLARNNPHRHYHVFCDLWRGCVFYGHDVQAVTH